VKSTEQFAWTARYVAKFMQSRPGNKDGAWIMARPSKALRVDGEGEIHSCVAYIGGSELLFDQFDQFASVECRSISRMTLKHLEKRVSRQCCGSKHPESLVSSNQLVS